MTKKTSAKHDHDDIKPQFDEALRLKEAGDFSEAAKIFLRLARQHPDVAAVHGMLGHVQQEMGNIRDAADSYRRAASISPGSELASISLFHALYKLRDVDGAFDEMRRFRSRGPSQEYDLIMSEFKGELPDEPEETASARQVVRKINDGGSQ